MARVAWWLFITARQIKQKPRTGASVTRCLAVRSLPPSGFSSGTQNQHKNDESPGGHSSLARRFLEKFQKREFHTILDSLYASIHHTVHAIIQYIIKVRFQLP